MLELIDSVLRTRAKEFLCTLRRSLAKDIDKRPELHPIPERLKLLTLLLNPNLLIINDANEGVGHERLQFVTKMSMYCGFILYLVKRACTIVNNTISTSSAVDLSE